MSNWFKDIGAQTTKVIVFIILMVWVFMTFSLLVIHVFVGMDKDVLVSVMNLYSYVNTAMIGGVISYLTKSTIENKSKYGDKPYGDIDTNK